MKSILFLTPRFIVGGAERYILVKSEWLRKHGYNVIVASEGGEWEGKLKDIGVKHYKLDWINKNPKTSRYEDNIKRLAELNDIIMQNNIEIVEANQMMPAQYIYYLSKIRYIPYIVNILSEIDFLSKRYINFLKEINENNLYYTFEDMTNSQIERVHNINLKNCKVLRIPIELENNFQVENENYILSICRMERDKMYIKYLIKNFYKYCNENKIRDYNLILVGNGSLFYDIKKLSDKYNKKMLDKNCKIVMKGTVVGEELEKLYKKCDIYVGVGTTILTAASYKKPCILATSYPNDFSKSYGYFKDYNGNISIGQVFGGMKKDSFKNLINKLKRDKEFYDNIQIEGYNIVLKNYEINCVMNKWILEYENVLKNKIDNLNFKIYKENEPVKTSVKRLFTENKMLIKNIFERGKKSER